MAYKPGDLLGELRIEREIGRGAWGIVYLAEDTLLARRVALKVLPEALAQAGPDIQQRVLTEARMVGALQSPNIVTLYRLREGPHGSWIQEMEFAEGGSLESRIQPDAPLAQGEAVRIFRGVCAGLQVAHEQRMIHGDIKPANVLFGKNDVVKLADFGLSRLLGKSGTSLSLHGEFIGTPEYMAPEVLTGQKTYPASDLWSSAVLFYRLLTGRMPFPAEEVVQLFLRVQMEEPELLGPGVPDPLAQFVLKCLAKSVEDRPVSCQAALDELDDCLGTPRPAVAVERGPSPQARAGPRTNCEGDPGLIGRDSELFDLVALLTDRDEKLCTITGPAGVGKTSIARELCKRLSERFEGGSWFVDLQEVTDADGVGQAVAQALNAQPGEGVSPISVVADVLRFRPPLVLVLDNFEQLAQHADATVGAWMRSSPHIRFVVTSRALLWLGGEHTFELAPLPVPDSETASRLDANAAATFPGVQLFVDRAREAQPGFELDDSIAQDVARICIELDGIPLAIELAAARVRMLKPREIAQKLGQKFQLLKTMRRDRSERQRTLLRAIEWSYDLLEEWERAAFLQACYFRDGFTLDAVEEVLDLSGFDEAPFALDLVQGLRDKSLLRVQDTGYDSRFTMYRALREFGEQRLGKTLDATGMADLSRRHAAFYLEYGEDWDRRIPGPEDQEAIGRVALEIGNLSRVHEWARQVGEKESAVRAALACAETMKVRRPPRELIPLLESTLEWVGDDNPDWSIPLLTYLSRACQRSGEWDRALECAEQAVELARASDDPAPLTAALLQQGDMYRNLGRSSAALAAFEECEKLARASAGRRALAGAIGGRGMVLGQQGDLARAAECLREAEEIAASIGDHQTVAFYRSNRGVTYELRGEIDDAITCYEDAEDLSRSLGDRMRTAVCVGFRANALVQKGELDAGMACYHEAEQISRDLGAKQRIAQLLVHRGGVHVMRDEIEQAMECYEEAEQLNQELGDRRGIAMLLGKRGNLLRREGRAEEALTCYREAESIGEEVEDRLLIALNRCRQGKLLADLGELDEAWERLRSGVALQEEMKSQHTVWGFTSRARLARLARSRGNRDQARELAAEACRVASDLGLTEQHPDPGVRDALLRATQIRDS